jgi:hypothetical protein
MPAETFSREFPRVLVTGLAADQVEHPSIL